jgi:hypothetical protein
VCDVSHDRCCESEQFKSHKLKKEGKVSKETSEEYAQQHNGPNWHESSDWEKQEEEIGVLR